MEKTMTCFGVSVDNLMPGGLKSVTSIEDLPTDLIVKILTISECLSVTDLASMELTCRTLGRNMYEEHDSLVEYAAFKLCASHPIYSGLKQTAKLKLFSRCNHNWKQTLNFVRLVEESSGTVKTKSGSNRQVITGSLYTIVLRDCVVYSTGYSFWGALGVGVQYVPSFKFIPVSFPVPVDIVHISGGRFNSAFITKSGDVYACGDARSCGLLNNVGNDYRPRLVEGPLKGIPCKQVAFGHLFSVFLTREGKVYTCGVNRYGQLGLGHRVDTWTPTIVEFTNSSSSSSSSSCVVQVSTGKTFTLAVTSDGSLYSFGYGGNWCLGHGEQRNEERPRLVEFFNRMGIHILRVSAGVTHVAALDSNGWVYTWGIDRYSIGILGHGVLIHQIEVPRILDCLKSQMAIQVNASKVSTDVLMKDGSLYGYGDKFRGQPFPRGGSVMELQSGSISQVSSRSYHTVLITNRGKFLGFGECLSGQLGTEKRFIPCPRKLCIDPPPMPLR